MKHEHSEKRVTEGLTNQLTMMNDCMCSKYPSGYNTITSELALYGFLCNSLSGGGGGYTEPLGARKCHVMNHIGVKSTPKNCPTVKEDFNLCVN